MKDLVWISLWNRGHTVLLLRGLKIQEHRSVPTVANRSTATECVASQRL